MTLTFPYRRLKSLGSRVAKAVTKPFSVPVGDEDTWSNIATKQFDANAKAHYAFLQALNDDDIARVIHCKSAYEIWSHLEVTHEETSQVKMAKIDLLRSQYEISPCMKIILLMIWSPSLLKSSMVFLLQVMLLIMTKRWGRSFVLYHHRRGQSYNIKRAQW